jgi:hypothetical protein
MKEKIKLMIGEELYDTGPAIIVSLVVIVGLIALIIKSLPNFSF